MADQTYSRTKDRHSTVKDIGPYEAIVVSHLDPMYMGTLEVELIKQTESGGTPQRTGQLITVRYLSPFYGVTPANGLTPNDGFQYTQKSYGMWMIPPDVGTRVLVIFAEGNTAYGYWIGCIPEIGMNFMVPGGGQAAASVTTTETPENLKGVKLPVGEYNKLKETGAKVDPTLFEKPYNKDFTEVLEVQGTLLDEARGTTTSSARREAPSMVFGISTPGPLDKRNKSPTAKYGADTESADMPYNRLGGTSFVMDDGDDKFIRATHAADGPPIYINREGGEAGGDETIPQNEHVRIRTRTGHQILMHNSEDLIYIANSRGTAWIELSSDGKIDIYAYDSISVMSDQDINFTAERDFNIDAGRNINMRAQARYSDGKETDNGSDSGRIQIESAFNTYINVGKDLKTTVSNNFHIAVDQSMKIITKSDYHLHSQAAIYQLSDTNTHEKAGHGWYREATNNINDLSGQTYFNKAANTDILSAGYIHSTAGAEIVETAAASISNNAVSIHHVASGGINLLGGSIIAGDAGAIHWNSGQAASGVNTAAAPATPTTPPEDAEKVERLPSILLPYIKPGAQQAVAYESILTRAPQHEPWPHHENFNPLAFRPDQTDREAPGDLNLQDRALTPDTFRKNKDGAATTTFVSMIGPANKSDFGNTGDGVTNGTNPSYTGTGGSRGGGTDGGYSGSDGTVSYNGQGTLVSIKSSSGKSAQVAQCFQEAFQGFVNDLEATGYKIKSMGGYARRNINGIPNKWSIHASGAAIDINPPNPAVNKAPNGLFRPRPANAPLTDMPVAQVRQLVKKWGLGWGGNWTSSDDAMHFSAAKSEGGKWPVKSDGTIPSNSQVSGQAPTTGLSNPLAATPPTKTE
jgi:hypothetical protein